MPTTIGPHAIALARRLLPQQTMLTCLRPGLGWRWLALTWLLVAAVSEDASPAIRPEVAAVRRITRSMRLDVAGYGPVRLHGVTVPKRLADGRSNPLVGEARSRLASLVVGRYVRIQPVGPPATTPPEAPTPYSTPRRHVAAEVHAFVWIETGTFVNEDLVRAGLARLSRENPTVRRTLRQRLRSRSPDSSATDAATMARLRAAEAEARAARRGIWAHRPGKLR